MTESSLGLCGLGLYFSIPPSPPVTAVKERNQGMMPLKREFLSCGCKVEVDQHSHTCPRAAFWVNPVRAHLGFWTQRLLAHNHLFPAGWEVCTALTPGKGSIAKLSGCSSKGSPASP